MMVKFVDLSAQNREIMPDIEREFARIHAATSYVDGPPVSEFEQEFARYLGVHRTIAVGNGTDALKLALIASGVRRGDEVLTTPMTFIATVEAIIQAGARPVFVDVDPKTGNLSPAELQRYLDKGRWHSLHGPRAILPVHLYGMPAEMPEICRIAAAHGLAVIEDACQAHGAKVRTGDGWSQAGTIGRAGCFSFYPGKNLGAWGDGGAVATDDEELAERIVRLRNHGRISHYAHEDCGYNSRLDTLQAAVLAAKLKRLEAWNERRRTIADSYREMLEGCGVDLPAQAEGFESCYHLFVIRSVQRDRIRRALLREHIECGIHYPVPLHLQPALRSLGYTASDFPHSERFADTVLSLPMHPHMTDLEVVQVADCVTAALKARSGLAADGVGDRREVPTASASRQSYTE